MNPSPRPLNGFAAAQGMMHARSSAGSLGFWTFWNLLAPLGSDSVQCATSARAHAQI
jgi:hypothetical protein